MLKESKNPEELNEQEKLEEEDGKEVWYPSWAYPPNTILAYDPRE